jgi:transcriptional regulator with XRE-family HTH domain
LSAEDLGRLKQARTKKGLSLRDLAKKVGVSRQALSAYENGTYPPSTSVWERLKAVLKLTGEIVDYWGREAGGVRIKMYVDGTMCSAQGCTEIPVSKGLCRKHYNQANYIQRKKAQDPTNE